MEGSSPIPSVGDERTGRLTVTFTGRTENSRLPLGHVKFVMPRRYPSRDSKSIARTQRRGLDQREKLEL